MPDTPAPSSGGNFLTRKFGPAPVWVYAVAGGALITLIALYKRGSSSQAQQQAAQASGTDTSGQLAYPPTVVLTPSGVTNTQPVPNATQPSGTPAPTGPTGQVTVSGPYPSGTIALWATPGASQLVSVVPNGYTLPSAGQPVQGAPFSAGAFPTRPGTSSSFWQPLQYAGRTVYAWAPDTSVTGATPGLGGLGDGFGGGSGGRAAIGTLRTMRVTNSARWTYLTPFQPTQYVNSGRGDGFGDGYGGAGAGGRAMAAISKRTGIPLARLKALNYHLHDGRGRYRGGIIRVS